VLSTPAFAEDEFQKLRARVLAGIRRRAEDIEEVHWMFLQRMLYAPHPYSRTAQGSEESVKSLTRQDLVDFHARFYRPDNLVLCVSGDFKSEEVKRLVPEVFADFLKPRSAKFEAPAVPITPSLTGKRESQDMPGAKQAILSLAFRGVDVRDPDRFPLDVLRGVLSGMGGRLFTELRDKQSLAYSVGAYLETGVDPGAVVFYIATEADKLDLSMAGIRTEIEKLRTEPVPADELERAKNQIVGAEARHRQSVAGVGQDMAFNELYGLGAEASLVRIREIEKVTAAEVQRVARKYLKEGSWFLAITKPGPQTPPAPASAGRSGEGSTGGK
jgi:zinc protease